MQSKLNIFFEGKIDKCFKIYKGRKKTEIKRITKNIEKAIHLIRDYGLSMNVDVILKVKNF